jgi:hypothetical protein
MKRHQFALSELRLKLKFASDRLTPSRMVHASASRTKEFQEQVADIKEAIRVLEVDRKRHEGWSKAIKQLERS